MRSSAVRPLAVARGGLCRRDAQPEEVTTEERCAGNATNLHGIQAVEKARNCAMTWRKKLSDELSVRSKARAGICTNSAACIFAKVALLLLFVASVAGMGW